MTYKLISLAALLLACSACTSTGATASTEDGANHDKPEYATGSIIAKKKASTNKGEAQVVSAEELEKLRQNSSIPVR